MHTNAPPAVRRFWAASTLLVGCLAWVVLPSTVGAYGSETPDDPRAAPVGWAWPVDSARIVHAYEAPAHRYGPGHRGIDLRLAGDDARVTAPAAGTVAFAGPVAGRGVVTIDHGDGLVTTLEPVHGSLAPGTAVARGAEVGTLTVGGHAEPGTVHFGVRWHGEYINPLLLLGEIPRAVLLPCC
jgi:murein DD-endopeptidase MepM/ murein hydrolase activator NlpD